MIKQHKINLRLTTPTLYHKNYLLQMKNSPMLNFWWETNKMAENSADSLPAKRPSPSSENQSHTSPSKSPNPSSAPQPLSASDPSKNPKKAAREAKKAEKQAKKQEKLKNKKNDSSEDSSEELSKPNQDLDSDPPSPKIKSQNMLEEEDDDYTPVDDDSNESDVSLLSEERDHGDMDNFDIEEYKKYLASQKGEDP